VTITATRRPTRSGTRDLERVRALGIVHSPPSWVRTSRHARIELGQAILVRGAAGSVGACATQMAKENGAAVRWRRDHPTEVG
jgi:NADPH:quinone reductase-like Zn-dependent oxidoreductase